MFTPDAPSFQTLRRVPLATIDAIVSARLGVKGNTQPAVFNRQIAMYLARHVGGWSTTAIGKFYSGSHHTTVLYMREVTGVDDAGRELLAAMQRAGACFTAEGVAMTAVIEEITGQAAFERCPATAAEEEPSRNEDSGTRRHTK